MVTYAKLAMFVNFSTLMVYLLMSGLFTPVSSMPEWAQWIARFNPMMHFIALMRAVVLTIAVRQYHKRSA